MALIVQKYGGTSVGTIEKIKNIAKKAVKLSKNNKLVIVVSAMGDSTDDLITLYKQITDKPNSREYDFLVSTGEQISASLLSMAIQSLGHDAIALTGMQAGIKTEEFFQKPRIVDIDPKRILKELKLNKIVVITGFQGGFKGEITTIGRGGSDTSAVAIAGAIKSDVCEIYTDVEGVYTADPRIVKNAHLIKEISYEEMLELASLGASVMHPRAVEYGQNHKVVIHVRSSFKDVEGTLIKEVKKKMERKNFVSGVALDKDIAKLTILNVPDKPGMAAKIFGALAAKKINVDMIIQSEHQKQTNDVSFTIGLTDYKNAIKISNEISKEIKAGNVLSDEDVSKISIVGVGMISEPGIAAKMFEALSKNKINIQLISTSEIKISCVINKSDGTKAINALHKSFNL